MYGCNVLNLGGSRIISVNPASARQIVKDPHFTGDIQVSVALGAWSHIPSFDNQKSVCLSPEGSA